MWRKIVTEFISVTICDGNCDGRNIFVTEVQSMWRPRNLWRMMRNLWRNFRHNSEISTRLWRIRHNPSQNENICDGLWRVRHNPLIFFKSINRMHTVFSHFTHETLLLLELHLPGEPNPPHTPTPSIYSTTAICDRWRQRPARRQTRSGPAALWTSRHNRAAGPAGLKELCADRDRRGFGGRFPAASWGRRRPTSSDGWAAIKSGELRGTFSHFCKF